MVSEKELCELAVTSLEAARLEICRRLADAGLPSVVNAEVVAVEDGEGGGWRTETRSVRRSGMATPEAWGAVRDDSVAGQLFGLREELEPLARHVDAVSELGRPQRSGLVPAATGPEAVLVRVAIPLARHYLESLEDVAQAQPELLEQLTDELLELVRSEQAISVSELALGGLETTDGLGPQGRISLRPLTGVEQGAFLAVHNPHLLGSRPDHPSFFVPRSHSWFRPKVLLSVESKRPADAPDDSADLIRRFVLALILCGFEVETSGMLATHDVPRWFSTGHRSQTFPIESGVPTPVTRVLSDEEFAEAVDLAHCLPQARRHGRESVVLERVMRGASGQSGAFLDNAIALEAALLAGAKTELKYRFSLYGALYLRNERDPQTTFAQLKEIYDVRSTIAHGGNERSDKRTRVEANAAALVRVVVRKAVTEGWPVPADLDAVALGACGNAT
jgi:hypothetical protein